MEISLRGGGGGLKLLLAVVYRPLHCRYLADFFNIFMDLSISYKYSIILGDFNADLGCSSYDSKQILSFVDSSNLFLIPYGPTYYLHKSSSTLDLCIIDDADKLISLRQHDVCFLSNHDLINITYKIKIERHPSRTISVRDFRSFSVDNFRNELSSYDWNSLLLAQDVNAKIDILNNFLLRCYNSHASYKSNKPKHLPAPWLTNDIKSKMRERDRAKRRWRRWKCTADYTAYRVLRNRVQDLICNAKRNYYHRVFHNSNDSNNIVASLSPKNLIQGSSSPLKN